jgi:hypothetical protein
MKYKFNWTVQECETLYPFEFDLYMVILTDQLEKEKAEAEQNQR